VAKKILFVDDEPDLLKVATFRLKKAGYEVVQAVDGQEALDILAGGSPPDLILLDLRLPVVSGYEVCIKVKGDEKTKNIPVILFTASTQDIARKAKEWGAEDYLLKPFEPEVLLEKVKRLLDKQGS